jgi:hypothetical protein
MAGSKKYFQYTCDDGTNFGLLADESNTEKVMGTAGDLTSDVNYQLPRNVEPRYAVYQNSEGKILKCYILTTTKYNTIQADTASFTHDGTTFNLVRKRPETIRLLPIASDTGLNDGDLT